MGHKKNAIIYAIFGLFWVLGACMPEIRNPYDPKTDEFWIVQALRCNILGECTEICEAPARQATASFPSTGAATSFSNAFYLRISSAGVAEEGKTTSIAQNASRLQSMAIDAIGRIHAAGNMTGANPFDFGLGSISASSTSLQNPLMLKY